MIHSNSLTAYALRVLPSLTEAQKTVFRKIAELGIASNEQVALALGKYPNQTSGRFTELRKDGHLELAKTVNGVDYYRVKSEPNWEKYRQEALNKQKHIASGLFVAILVGVALWVAPARVEAKEQLRLRIVITVTLPSATRSAQPDPRRGASVTPTPSLSASLSQQSASQSSQHKTYSMYSGEGGKWVKQSHVIIQDPTTLKNDNKTVKGLAYTPSEYMTPLTYPNHSYKTNYEQIKGLAMSMSNDWESWMEVIAKESGFNPQAINVSSGACGLGQALPCEKMGCSLDDLSCQMSWMNRYITSRYGSPSNALKFHRANGWY